MEPQQHSGEIDPARLTELTNRYKALAQEHGGSLRDHPLDPNTTADLELSLAGQFEKDTPGLPIEANDMVDWLYIRITDHLHSSSQATTIYRIRLTPDNISLNNVNKSHYYQNQSVRQWYETHIESRSSQEPTFSGTETDTNESEYFNPDNLTENGAPPEIIEAAQELSIRANQDAQRPDFDIEDVDKLEEWLSFF